MPISKETIGLLRNNRYKLTPQRKAVLRVLTASTVHLTPAAIYERVVRRYPRISLVTVYRTLNILNELGLVCEVRTGANSKSYVAGNQEHHGHLICTRCGRVSDFTGYDIDELVRQIGGEFDYKVMDHRLDLYGLCPECAARG